MLGEQILSRTSARQDPRYFPGVLILTTQRLIYLPRSFWKRVILELPDVRAIKVFRKPGLWYWKIILGQWIGSTRWFTFLTDTEEVTFICSSRKFYEALKRTADEKGWPVEDTTK